MKFNSQICTTKEQSERLLALGLKKETADCHVMLKSRGEMYYVGFDMCCYRDYYARYGRKHNYQPAWSLHRLMEIMYDGDVYGCITLNVHNRNIGTLYECVIAQIKMLIEINLFNKDYLEKKTMNERETKYKVGDEVWYRFISHNMRTTIRRIKIDHKGVPLYFCDFYLTTASFKEEDLFATEEELINHLKDNK